MKGLKKRGFIVCADLHAHDWKEGGEPAGGINGRLLDWCNALREMIGYARELDVRAIYVLGDVFHLKKNINEQVRNQVFNYFYHARDLNLFFIAGNHDRENDRYDSVTIWSFKAFANVIIEPEVDTVNDIVFAPWLYEQERVLKFLKQQKKERETLMFHGELDGAEVGPTDYMLKSTFTEKSLGVGLYGRAFAGHLHKRQHVHGVDYPGSFIAKDFGELEQDKGVLYVDPDGRVSTLELQSPKFVVMHVDPIGDPDAINWKDFDGLFKGNLIRLFSKRPLDSAFVKRLEQCNPRYLDIRPERVDQAQIVRLQAAGSRSFKELVEGYVAHRQVPDDLKEAYVDYGRKVLES
jgi:DNA repair exonuclease SbcCD nuclease subunit